MHGLNRAGRGSQPTVPVGTLLLRGGAAAAIVPDSVGRPRQHRAVRISVVKLGAGPPASAKRLARAMVQLDDPETRGAGHRRLHSHPSG